MRPLPSQHRRFHSGERIQPEKFAHDSPVRQADIGFAHVWAKPEEGPRHGAADPQPTSAQGIRVPSRRRVPTVSVM